MALTTDQRLKVYKKISKYLSNNLIETSLLKSEFKDAVNGLDAGIDSVMSTLNQSIPEPARTELTTKLKVFLFKIIFDERWEVE